jgi:uncharacterized protein
MILEIRLSNFFSIKDEVVLDFRAASIKSKNARELESNVFKVGKEDVLKIITIYGANASGKSNIINAIRFCIRMIVNSHLHNENDVFNFKKFKFSNYSNKPSYFFIRFISNEIEYEYSFSLMENRILKETLNYSPKGRVAKVFVRDENKGPLKGNIYSFGTGINSPMIVAESTSDKTLFLSRASQMDRALAKELFSYFANKFISEYIGHSVLQLESLFNTYKQNLLVALRIADSDIVDVKIKKHETPTKNVHIDLDRGSIQLNDILQDHLEIRTFHRAEPSVGFDFLTEESEGTKKLFFIMLNLFDVIANDKILLVDEIGESLHAEIIEYIFNIFRAGENSQLVCTTHNTKFLDLKKFRKDQIFFANKTSEGSTDLYSLYDYSDFRDTMDLEKAYLQGRFDAFPFVDDSIDKLKSMLQND